jgi:hypothetical protein
MTDSDQGKSRFEPPPWEQEAFEAFRREQAEREAEQALEAALRAMKSGEAPLPQPGTRTSAEPAAESPQAQSEDAKPRLSEDRIKALMVQLRVEEPPVAGPNVVLVNAVSAVLLVAGLVISLEAVLLFGRTRGASQQALLLAGTTSIIVLFVGVGFVAGAVALFRKYHKS